MKPRTVNLGRTDENIAEQYPNVCEGLQKDAAQNSWDARATNKGKDWKLVFKYFPHLNHLSIEDYGTLGMNAQRWKNYQGLWDTTKMTESALGARGQGKFLFHYFSADKLVLTESIDEDGVYRFSWGYTGEYDDENKRLEDFIPGEVPLTHEGTRIWIMNLKEELRSELFDQKAFMNYMSFSNYIAATWWEIIRNWGAAFIIDFDGAEHKVELPSLPHVSKEVEFSNEKIGEFGRVKKLVLWYCDSEVPEVFRGVAVQRGGMTVLRMAVFADETVKNRIHGYCTFDQDLERELKKVELPNHFGFVNKKVWNHTKEYIRRKSDGFVQEISPIKKKDVTVSEDLVARAVRAVNDLVREYAPELASEVTGPRGKAKKTGDRPTKPPPPVRIDTFRGNARKLEYDESLITECELINDTNDETTVSLEILIEHQEGDCKSHQRYQMSLASKAIKRVDMPLLDFEEGVDKAGEYTATAVLREGEEAEIHRRSFTFYLHEDPPPPRGRVFLSIVKFINGKGTPLERKRHLPVTENGLLRIIYDHPDFVHARDLTSSKKGRTYEILLYTIKCGVDEAVQKLLEFRYNEGELGLDELRDIKGRCDAMYYDAALMPME